MRQCQCDEHLMDTNPAHCPALQQRAGPRPPQSGPSVTSKCTSLQCCSSHTLQGDETHRCYWVLMQVAVVLNKTSETTQKISSSHCCWGEEEVRMESHAFVSLSYIFSFFSKILTEKIIMDTYKCYHKWFHRQCSSCSHNEWNTWDLPSTFIRWQCTSSISSAEVCDWI